MSRNHDHDITISSNGPISIQDHIHSQVSTRSHICPNSEALAFSTGSWTYQDLELRSTELSHYLRHVGVTRWQNVGICFRKSKWAVVSMIGVLKVGASCVPLDPDHPKARIEAIIDAASICTILVENVLQSLESFIEVRQISVNELEFGQMSHITNPITPALTHHIDRNNTAFVLFTSGSTGSPKAVVLSHFAVCASAKYHGEPLLIGPGTRVYQHAAYTFDMSIYDIFTTLIRGGTVCIPDHDVQMQHIAESVKQLRSNWAFFTPTFLSTLHPDEVPGLQTILLAGEPMPQELIDTWASRVCLLNGYGSTEMSTCFLAHVVPTADSRNIGTPRGVIARIVDLHDPSKDASADVGELVVCGPVLASGYLSKHANTDAFNRRPLFEGNVAYRTGDVVQRMANGSYLFLGRRDTLVKIRGFRVELGEIEHQLMSHPIVTRAVVLYPTRGMHSEKLTAIVQLAADHTRKMCTHSENPGLSTWEQVLSDHLREVLPEYMVPPIWLEMPRMSMTSSGKIDRRAITSAVEQDRTEGPVVPQSVPRSFQAQPNHDSEISTSEINVALANVAFLDLGLDSINLIGLSKVLKKAYDLNFDVATLGQMSLDTLLPHITAKTSDNKLRAASTISPRLKLSELFCRLHRTVHHVGPPPGGASTFTLPSPAFAQLPVKYSLNVLLTGATGFLGVRVLERLMKILPPRSKVVALVRAPTPSSGLRRLLDVFDHAGIVLSCENLARLEVWPGDLCQPKLGLETQQWKRLKAHHEAADNAIDIVIHNGAVVNWSLAYEALEAANVHSTISLLRVLQDRTTPAMMVYVSGGRTLEIALDHDLVFPTIAAYEINSSSSLSDEASREWDMVEKSSNSLTGYDISKLFSDSLVTSSMSRAVNSQPNIVESSKWHAYVIRPGYIIGDSNMGQVNAEDYIWRVVATALRTRKRCEEPATSFLYLSGVDDVAEDIIQPVRIMYETIAAHSHGHAAETNISVGVTMYDFWITVATVYDINLTRIGPEAWLAAVDENMMGSENPEDHPLYPVSDTHREDGGLLGLAQADACERGSDATALKCFKMSLQYLKKESAIFNMWIGA